MKPLYFPVLFNQSKLDQETLQNSFREYLEIIASLVDKISRARGGIDPLWSLLSDAIRDCDFSDIEKYLQEISEEKMYTEDYLSTIIHREYMRGFKEGHRKKMSEIGEQIFG